ncbi:sulfotransferase family protein [Sphingobium sp. HWE2-09]|uniref:sulfotransferase family protein n=1 Tax=Sphingobium sp. HWE2-09 TaxID=3108390 RepID=UPI002DD39D4B|nr:sulfotransferase [Sphingobium sp. HWE2-09]
MTLANAPSLLVGGCPRSGTSWVHFMLATHPDTVTCRETHVYDKYVGPLKDWYDQEYSLEASDGLSAIFDETEFVDTILAPIVQTTLARIAAKADPGKIVLEKTPGNILYHELVARIQPDAKFLFVARDPRAVYASFKAASKESWGGWTHKPIADFCQSWTSYMLAYLAARSYMSADRLMCVHYEKLKTDTARHMADILKWAGLKTSKALLGEIVEKNGIDALRAADVGTLAHDTRKDFYRVGKAYGWVDELDISEIREIEKRCINAMTVMGYARYSPLQAAVS